MKLCLFCLLPVVALATLQIAFGHASGVKGCARVAGSRVASATFGNPVVGDRVYFPAVSSLTFSADQIAIFRRGQPHPQLACVGGSAAEISNQVAIVDCFNVGLVESVSDQDAHGLVPLWSCMPSPVTLHVEISDPRIFCEGYSYDGDSYVLRGSCYLTYRLDHCDDLLDSQSANGGADQRDNGLTLVRRVLMRGGMLVVVMACIVAMLSCIRSEPQLDDGHFHDDQTSLLSREQS